MHKHKTPSNNHIFLAWNREIIFAKEPRQAASHTNSHLCSSSQTHTHTLLTNKPSGVPLPLRELSVVVLWFFPIPHTLGICRLCELRFLRGGQTQCENHRYVVFVFVCVLCLLSIFYVFPSHESTDADEDKADAWQSLIGFFFAFQLPRIFSSK